MPDPARTHGMRNGIHYAEPQRYYLLRSTLTFPNPACAPQVTEDWYKKVSFVKDGVVQTTGWGFWLGSGWTTLTDPEVLDTVDLSEGAWVDTTRTSLYRELIAAGEVQRAAGKSLSGWLSPDGEWFPCAYHKHDTYASYVLGARHDAAWLRVNTEGWALGQPSTDAQAAWLLDHRE